MKKIVFINFIFFVTLNQVNYSQTKKIVSKKKTNSTEKDFKPVLLPPQEKDEGIETTAHYLKIPKKSIENKSPEISDKFIEHTWEFYNYETVNNNLPESDEVSTIQRFARAKFRFYPNGKLIAMLLYDGYFVGKWEKGKIKNSFIIKGDFLKKPILFKIGSTSPDFTTFTILNKEYKSTNLSMMLSENDGAYKIDDIDFLEEGPLNQWRIRSNQPENDSLLRKRCSDMLTFSITLLNKSIKIKKNSSGYDLMQIPFEVYDGVILLPSFENVSPKWIGIFNNEQDSRKGYEMLLKAFEGIKKHRSQDISNATYNNEAYLKTFTEVKENLLNK
jgi:hypothetical protein